MLKSELHHYTAYSRMRTTKVSADQRNKTFTYALEGDVYLGVPDIPWDKVIFIDDKKWIWTHGVLYDCSRGMLTLTQAEYDAIRKVNMSTIYLIKEDDEIVKIYFGSVPVITESAIAALLDNVAQQIATVRASITRVESDLMRSVNKVSNDLQQHAAYFEAWKQQNEKDLTDLHDAIAGNAEQIDAARQAIREQNTRIDELSDHTDASREAVLKLNERVTEAERKAGEAKELSQQSARDSLSSRQDSVTAQAAAVEAARAAAEAEAKAAAVAEAIGNLNTNPDTALAGQVLQNAQDIAALKEKTSVRNPNVSLELDDDGDLILTTAEDSAVVGGEIDEDGNVLLNILLM